MLKYLFTLLFVFTLCRADLLFPEKGQELNYTHVLFEWDQEPNAGFYNLQISNSESFDNVILDLNEETTMSPLSKETTTFLPINFDFMKKLYLKGWRQSVF